MLLFICIVFLLKKQIFHTINILFFLFCSIFFLLIFWCFIIKECSSIIFYYSFSMIIIWYLCAMLYYTLSKYCFILQYQPLALTILFSSLYHSSLFFNQKTILPLFYPLTPLSFFQAYGLPLFMPDHPWLYCFIYFVIIYHIKINIIIIYSIIGMLFFYYPIENQYWITNQNKSKNKEDYLYKNIIIFPEGYCRIYNQKDLNKYKKLSKKHQKIVIIGCHWEEYNQPYEQNGIAIINPNGNLYFQKKYPLIPFAETKNPYQQEHQTYQKKYPHILICSEFFLLPLTKQIQLQRPIILITSLTWTKTKYTFWGRYVMEAIYKLYEFSIKKLDGQKK